MQVTRTVQYQVQVNRMVQGKDGESHTETHTETRTREVTEEVPDPPRPEPDRHALVDKGRESRMGLDPATEPDSTQASAERVRAETQKSAAEGARALREEVEQTAPARRPELLERLRPTLQEISKGANGTPDEGDRRSILRDLSRAADAAGPEGARTLAREFASQTVNQHTDVDNTDQLGGALKATLEEGASPLFARALASELGHNPELAEARANVTQATAEAMHDVRADFEETADKVDELNHRLNTYLENVGPALSDAEERQFIDDFKARHPEYSRLEKEAGRLADHLDDAVAILDDPSAPEELRDEARATFKDLPRVGDTEVGQARLRQDLLDQQAGKPSILTAAAEVDDKAFRGQVADVTTKAVASELLRSGDGRDLIEALKGNAKLFGVDDPGRMAQIVAALQGVADGKPEAIADLDAKTEGLAKEVASRFKGLGIVANLASVVENLGKFDEGSVLDKINAGATVLGAAGGAAEIALSALGRNAAFLSKSLPIVGIVGTLAGSVQDIADGHVGKGALDLGVAALTMAVPEAAIPVAALMLVNELTKHRDLVPEKEQELRDLLKPTSLGALKPEAMDALVEGGDAEAAGQLAQLAPYLGVSPQEALLHMNALDPDQITDYLAASHHVRMEPGAREYRTEPTITDRFMVANRQAGAREVAKRAQDAWLSGEWDGRKLNEAERGELHALSVNASAAAGAPESVGVEPEHQLDHLAFGSTTGYVDYLRRRDLLPRATPYGGPH